MLAVTASDWTQDLSCGNEGCRAARVCCVDVPDGQDGKTR